MKSIQDYTHILQKKLRDILSMNDLILPMHMACLCSKGTRRPLTMAFEDALFQQYFLMAQKIDKRDSTKALDSLFIFISRNIVFTITVKI